MLLNVILVKKKLKVLQFQAEMKKTDYLDLDRKPYMKRFTSLSYLSAK